MRTTVDTFTSLAGVALESVERHYVIGPKNTTRVTVVEKFGPLRFYLGVEDLDQNVDPPIWRHVPGTQQAADDAIEAVDKAAKMVRREASHGTANGAIPVAALNERGVRKVRKKG